jgi:hypothetical protein
MGELIPGNCMGGPWKSTGRLISTVLLGMPSSSIFVISVRADSGTSLWDASDPAGHVVDAVVVSCVIGVV